MADAFEVAETLQEHGQSHLLVGIDALTAEQRETFIQRLSAIDWAELAHPAAATDPQQAQPSRVITLAERAQRGEALRAQGQQAYADGAVAVLMVAGGQGTRLGFQGPKGCFEIGAHSGKSIYQIQAEKVLSLSQRLGRPVPFLVMTSPATDVETRTFFAAHECFGLEQEQLRIFSQGTVPSIDTAGRALLSGPGQLLENPDGHGGCFTALVDSGQLQRLKDEGVRQLVYIQVDNVLAQVDDVDLVGLAELERADVVTKVLPKAHPDERVGHLVRIADRDRIVEYTEVTTEQARMVGDDGELIYRWGSPALHCWSIAFLSGLQQRQFVPPLHRSKKPLTAWVDGEPSSVDGFKNERFIFDLLPEATVSLGLEVDRNLEFAPVKNAEGTDSAASAQAIASAAWTTWFEQAGVAVDLEEGQYLEVSPLFAATADQFQQRWDGRSDRIRGAFYLEGDTVVGS